MIQIQHLTKRFAAAGATVVALNDINLEIQDGDIYGLSLIHISEPTRPY